MSISATPPLQISARTKQNVGVLVAAQAILGSQMPIVFILGGLAGQSLTSNVCFATLPISLIVLGSMLSATPLSAIMQRFGRRIGFFIGTAGGTLGASIGALGLYTGSFALLLLGSLFTGIYMSAQGFYRFAAVDAVSEDYRAKAISFVMAGGLVAAVMGPQIVKLTSEAMVIPFLGAYLSVIVLNVVGSGLFLMLELPKPEAASPSAQGGRSRLELLKSPRVAVSIICAMVAYALMNLVMTSTPLAVVGCGFTQNNAADVVMGHVLAMFVPSFFTGHLIVRFGAEKIVATGLVFLAAAGTVAISGIELGNFFGTLILLGIGWNFGFIGATTMLASAHTPQEQGRIQGLNDMIVFGFVTLGSVASGGLMNCSGGSPVEGWISVNLAMVPLLALAGGSLFWLTMRPYSD